jgi:hypothetical protein
MRTTISVPLAALLVLTIAAPVAAGPNVGNSSGSLTIAQANWDTSDGDTYGSGYLSVSTSDGDPQAMIEFSEYHEAWVQCSGAETPDDESDDWFAPVGTSSYGWGSGDLTVGRNYGDAQATGTLEVYTETFDGCAGDSDGTVGQVDVALSLVGTGALVRESGRGSFHIPGVYNGHDSYRSAYRMAEGSVALGDRAFETYGLIGKISWMSHSNG